MKINTFNKKLANFLLLSTIICLLGVFSVSTFVPVQAAETHGDELAIIQLIHEGPHETVLIVNLTTEKIDLCDYSLKAEKAGLTFNFDVQADCRVTVAPLSVIRLHSGAGSSQYYASWNDVPWTQQDVWDDNSDKATLIGPDGNVTSAFSYGEDYE
ncbi:lamin tail domain-containing protein [Candidatus Bipolaricaulota bacterium]|nr:lamin tail domain-containing protein [Candidatus Bipolaricaulota bacterium]